MIGFKQFLENKISKYSLPNLWYHGTIAYNVDAILETGIIKPRLEERPQVSGGLMFERPFTYWGPYSVAYQYANGIESGKEQSPGAVFVISAHDERLKIINLKAPLDNDQIEIVNKYLPDYKPLKEGEPLNAFVWRTNNHNNFVDVLTELGFNAYLQSPEQLAILGEVHASIVTDLRKS